MKQQTQALRIFSLFLVIALLFSACKKDDDTDNTPATVPMSALDLSINYFIWENMSMYYLWTEDVSLLDAANYSSRADLDVLLKKYSDHEIFFNKLLYKKGDVDRFSWIVDDYEVLEQQFQGVSKSMGYDFILGAISNTNNVFGVVRYVIKGSPAEKAGLKRGDFFTHIDGTQLNKTNYETLLSNTDAYSVGIATVTNHAIGAVSKTLYMVAEEVHENPIFLDTVYNINSTKIGYLVYNGFMPNFDNKLNAVFAGFKTAGVQKLILDLRYNPGGALTSATYLASMIYSTSPTKIFVKNSYNTEFQKYIVKQNGADYLNTYLTDKIINSDDTYEEPIASIGVSSLCVIATKSSASASEILINGLRPFIPVTIVGDTTYGKYVGSITIKDYDTDGNVNKNHKWALQPIVMKATNANGVSDFTHGLPADILVDEDFSNLLPLGDTNDPLLKAAIARVTGKNDKKSFNPSVFKTFAEAKDLLPHSRELYLNKNLLKK